MMLRAAKLTRLPSVINRNLIFSLKTTIRATTPHPPYSTPFNKLRSITVHASISQSTKTEHNANQAEYFARELTHIEESITTDVRISMQTIADAVPHLTPQTRVLDVGAGTGVLIPHLQSRGVQDVLAIDICPAMIDQLQTTLGTSSTVGNEPGIRTWVGDIDDLPSYQGPFDVAFFNAVFGNLWEPRTSLLKTVFMMKPGGYIVISHPLGRQWHRQYRSENMNIVPHDLPNKQQLEELIADFPLQIHSFRDDDQLYIAVLKIPEGYAHPAAPIHLSGTVITGFGRGSKQLGVPTANLPPQPLAPQLQHLPAGVYFGWAKVKIDTSIDTQSHSEDIAKDTPPAEDSMVHKMVMNVGKRPTFEDQDPEVSVELHIMHSYKHDFYGKEMKAVVLGHIRPEVKFNGLGELLGRIKTDIGIAKSQLDTEKWRDSKHDPFLEF